MRAAGAVVSLLELAGDELGDEPFERAVDLVPDELAELAGPPPYSGVNERLEDGRHGRIVARPDLERTDRRATSTWTSKQAASRTNE